MYHTDIKIQRKKTNIAFFVINNMQSIKYYIMLAISQTGVHEVNEKLLIKFIKN